MLSFYESVWETDFMLLTPECFVRKACRDNSQSPAAIQPFRTQLLQIWKTTYSWGVKKLSYLKVGVRQTFSSRHCWRVYHKLHKKSIRNFIYKSSVPYSYSSKWISYVLHYLICVIYLIYQAILVFLKTPRWSFPTTLYSLYLGFPLIPARGLCTIRPRAVPVLTQYGQMRLLHLPSPVSTLVRQIFKSPDFASPEGRITACFLRCSLQGKMCSFFTPAVSSDFTPLSPVRKR